MLHSICQQIWKTQQWPQDWKKSVFIPIPKKGNAKKCSNYHTSVLISHASKVMLKILQARLQQYMNWELSDAQAGYRKGRGGEVVSLSDPMDGSPPGFSYHGVFQARILGLVAIFFSRGSSDPRIELGSLALQADSLPAGPRGNPNQRSNCQHLLDHRKSKRVSEKHLLYWLRQFCFIEL